MNIQSIHLKNEFQGVGKPLISVLGILYCGFLLFWAFLPFLIEFKDPPPVVGKLIGAGIMVFIGISLGRVGIFLLEDQLKYFTRSMTLSDSIEVQWFLRRRQYAYTQVKQFSFTKHEGELDQWGLFRFSEIDLVVQFQDDETAQLTLRQNQRDEVLMFLKSKGFLITTELPE